MFAILVVFPRVEENFLRENHIERIVDIRHDDRRWKVVPPFANDGCSVYRREHHLEAMYPQVSTATPYVIYRPLSAENGS